MSYTKDKSIIFGYIVQARLKSEYVCPYISLSIYLFIFLISFIDIYVNLNQASPVVFQTEILSSTRRLKTYGFVMNTVISKGGNLFCERLPLESWVSIQLRTCSRVAALAMASRDCQLEVSKYTEPPGKRLM